MRRGVIGGLQTVERLTDSALWATSVLCMLLAIVVHHDWFAIENRLKVYLASPELLNIFQRFSSILDVQIYSFVLMFEVELAVAVVIAVSNFDVRKAEVGHIADELVADPLPFLIGYGPFFVVKQLVDKQVELFTEFFG